MGGRPLKPGSPDGRAVGRALLRGFVGLLHGIVAGLVVVLAVVVVRARLQGLYLHSLDEVGAWAAVPPVAFASAGVWLAISPRHRLGPAALAGFVGSLTGIVVGASAGALLSPDPAWGWAGGIMGAAAGLTAGFLGRVIRDVRGPGRSAAALGLLVLTAVACEAPSASLPPAGAFAEPDAAEVQSVVYLMGDPGLARRDTHPVLTALRRDVERWSGRLAPGGDVVLVVLGDIVYPDGVHPPGSEAYGADSAVVADQVWTLEGPEARRIGARGFFVAGNHDWGRRGDWAGAVRLEYLDALLGSFAARGVEVSLEPRAGTGGPSVVDVGPDLRLLLLDTAWWLYAAEPWTKHVTVEGVRRALADAGDRRTLVAAHHPLRSGGPHGALDVVGSTLGLRTLLARSGALLQDLHSEPYRDLLARLEGVFAAESPPDVFAGGHEHSLQILRRTRPVEPALHVVSGSASKLTDVEAVEGTAYAVSAPGYVRLFVMRDGALHVTVEAAPRRYLSCAGEGEAVGACLEEGVDAFRTVWAGGM